MTFNGNHNFTIGTATNIVYRDQHNQTLNFQFGRVDREETRKENGPELIEEYRKILLGDIYKVKDTGSGETWERGQDDNGKCVNKCIGKRTWYHARLYGDNKVYTGVTYSGRDASKLWKEDFVKYSGTHDLSDSAIILQLFGANRSKVPALIFYDEWLPMAHFCSSRDKFWMMLYAQLLSGKLGCNYREIWFNSQSGRFCRGPQGISYWSRLIKANIDEDICSTADMLQVDNLFQFLNKLSLNLDSYVLRYAAFHEDNVCFNHLFGAGHLCTRACPDREIILDWETDSEGLWQREPVDYIHDNEVLDFLDDLRFDTMYSGRQRCEMARIAEGAVLYPHATFNFPPFVDRKLVQGGMTRFLFDFDAKVSRTFYSAIITSHVQPDILPRARVSQSRLLQARLSKVWLSQAHHHFGCDVDVIESCFYLDFAVDIGVYSRANGCSGREWNQPAGRQGDSRATAKPTVYFFFRPLPTRPSEVGEWANGEPFFWSFDENGTTRIPELTRELLGLPYMVLDWPRVGYYSWSKYVYDAIHRWQVAKGFDPATPDFARSLGIPILENLRPEKSRSEETVKQEHENTGTFGGSFRSRLSKLAWWQAGPDIPAFG